MSKESNQSRWFSTGYLAHGIGAVKPEIHALENANVIQVGEAKGHGLWIDEEFCASVVEAGNATGDKGLKARFGHPDMCSDALGTFLGKWKNFSIGSDGIARGTLFLSSTASESPKGDLRKYIEEMATKEPDYFGTSIVFSRDFEKEDDFMSLNTVDFDLFDELGNKVGTQKRFKSPDSRNVNNYPHARLQKIHAADLVDDPAATDSMFSGVGGTELASKVSEYLDTHPEILKSLSDNKEIVEILSKYPDQIKPFIDRFTANRKEKTNMEAEKITEVAESTTTTTTVTTVEKTEEAEPAETAETVKPDEAKPVEEEAAPSGELATIKKEIEELAKAKEEADAKLSEQVEIEKLKAEKEKLKSDLDEANRKLAALQKGEPVLTSTSAETEKKGSMWADARKSK
jgi:hypothetical protein